MAKGSYRSYMCALTRFRREKASILEMLTESGTLCLSSSTHPTYDGRGYFILIISAVKREQVCKMLGGDRFRGFDIIATQMVK